jgi:hypothetical protein
MLCRRAILLHNNLYIFHDLFEEGSGEASAVELKSGSVLATSIGIEADVMSDIYVLYIREANV